MLVVPNCSFLLSRLLPNVICLFSFFNTIFQERILLGTSYLILVLELDAYLRSLAL